MVLIVLYIMICPTYVRVEEYIGGDESTDTAVMLYLVLYECGVELMSVSHVYYICV